MKKSLSADLPSTSATILALEASASQLSIALMRDGHLLATRQHLAAHGHAVGIVPLTIETLHEAGETFDAITHVAAGCGPGSFTGIRVTLAAAKGFCMAHQAVGVGISGLQALAGAASDAEPHATSACLTSACLTSACLPIQGGGRFMRRFLMVMRSHSAIFLNRLSPMCRV